MMKQVDEEGSRFLFKHEWITIMNTALIKCCSQNGMSYYP